VASVSSGSWTSSRSPPKHPTPTTISFTPAATARPCAIFPLHPPHCQTAHLIPYFKTLPVPRFHPKASHYPGPRKMPPSDSTSSQAFLGISFAPTGPSQATAHRVIANCSCTAFKPLAPTSSPSARSHLKAPGISPLPNASSTAHTTKSTSRSPKGIPRDRISFRDYDNQKGGKTDTKGRNYNRILMFQRDLQKLLKVIFITISTITLCSSPANTERKARH